METHNHFLEEIGQCFSEIRWAAHEPPHVTCAQSGGALTASDLSCAAMDAGDELEERRRTELSVISSIMGPDFVELPSKAWHSSAASGVRT